MRDLMKTTNLVMMAEPEKFAGTEKGRNPVQFEPTTFKEKLFLIYWNHLQMFPFGIIPVRNAKDCPKQIDLLLISKVGAG
jgi:hypothetical protein